MNTPRFASRFSRLAYGAVALAALVASAGSASAHAVLSPDTAVSGGAWRGVVRISHGCEGSPTRLVRVTIPPGVVLVKPKAKYGWLVETTWAPYATPVEAHGKKLDEGVKTITWKGAVLPDHMYDEFAFMAQIQPDAPLRDGKLVFPVYQECEKGSLDWAQTAAAGVDPHTLKAPAPTLTVLAAAQSQASDATHGHDAGHAGGHAHDHAQPAGQAAATGAFHGGAASPAGKAAQTEAQLALTSGWTRATPAGAKVAGAYITVVNNGAKADLITGGRFDVAGRVEIHDMTMDDGVMRMRRLEHGLDVPAGGKVELRPGGLHIMLMDLKRPLKQGETISGVLTFRDAGDVSVTLPVEAAGAPAPGKAAPVKAAPGKAGAGQGQHQH